MEADLTKVYEQELAKALTDLSSTLESDVSSNLDIVLAATKVVAKWNKLTEAK